MYNIPNNSPLEKEVQRRVLRGVELLDKATPEWWKSINPSTLKISNRQMCVMAQASHSFTEGITQVAQAALGSGVPVKLMNEDFKVDNYGELRRKSGGDERPWIHDKFVEIFRRNKGAVIDVFHYGVAIDDQLRRLAHNRSTYTAWAALTAAWKAVVVAKKSGDQ